MFYGEIIAVCSEIHTKHINILCRQNVELLNVMEQSVSKRLHIKSRHRESPKRQNTTVSIVL